MEKSLSRKLFLSGLGLNIVSLIFLIISGYTDQWPPSMPRIIGLTGVMLGSIIFFSAYIGALVKMAQLTRWGWFVFLLLCNFFAMLIYIIAGPTTTTDPPPFDYASHGYHQQVTWGPHGREEHWVK